jgi:hypothetical protein
VGYDLTVQIKGYFDRYCIRTMHIKKINILLFRRFELVFDFSFCDYAPSGDSRNFMGDGSD